VAQILIALVEWGFHGMNLTPPGMENASKIIAAMKTYNPKRSIAAYQL
jgi:hypothetical protein